MSDGGGLRITRQLEGTGDGTIIISLPFVGHIVDLPLQGIQELGNRQSRSWMLIHSTRGLKLEVEGWSTRASEKAE